MTYGEIRFQLKQRFPGATEDLMDGWIMARHESIMSALNWERLQASREVPMVAEVTAGTVTVNVGSVVINGTGTAWATFPEGGDTIRIDNRNEWYGFRASGAVIGALSRPYEGPSGTFTYRMGRSAYTLPADVRHIRGVRAVADGRALVKLSREQFAANFSNRGTFGKPQYWTAAFDLDSSPPLMRVEVYPIPQEVEALLVDVALDSGGILQGQTSTSLLPWERPGCLLDGASADACMWLMTRPDPPPAVASAVDRYEAAYVRQLADMQRIDSSRRGSVKLQAAPEVYQHRLRRWGLR